MKKQDKFISEKDKLSRRNPDFTLPTEIRKRQRNFKIRIHESPVWIRAVRHSMKKRVRVRVRVRLWGSGLNQIESTTGFVPIQGLIRWTEICIQVIKQNLRANLQRQSLQRFNLQLQNDHKMKADGSFDQNGEVCTKDYLLPVSYVSQLVSGVSKCVEWFKQWRGSVKVKWLSQKQILLYSILTIARSMEVCIGEPVERREEYVWYIAGLFLLNIMLKHRRYIQGGSKPLRPPGSTYRSNGFINNFILNRSP